MTYQNPVISGFHPDPSICRVGEDYYLVTSSFEYFPGVPLFHSRDLLNWRQIGNVLTRKSQLDFQKWSPSGGIFAPTLRHHEGTFYMVTTNVSGGGNFYVQTNDIAGDWSDPIWLEQGGIDPSLFFDDDGKVYLTSSWGKGWPSPPEILLEHEYWGIQQSEIDLQTGKCLTEPKVIWHGTGGRYPEGPHLYKMHGKYYLMIAEGGTERGHMITLARSDSPWGPWESCPHNPILTNRSLQSPHQALGHGDLVEAHDGSWWMVCLGIRPQGNPETAHLGRETHLVPVKWNAQGWPVVGDQGVLRQHSPLPEFPLHSWPAAEQEDFRGPDLHPKWVTLGHAPGGMYSLAERPGSLRLQGNAKCLDDGQGVAFLGTAQTQYTCDVSVHLDFVPLSEGEEAGITVWMNPQHHYDLLITLKNGARVACLRKRIDDLIVNTAGVALQEGPVTLKIQALPEKYTFLVMQPGTAEHVVGSGVPRYLSPEVAGGFTGVMLGLCATGNGKGQMPPAYFSKFRSQG
ncbi:glycoside hydrolase family 43 protein [Deinococcus cellulosilyticus]|uniref:Glycoside hydrolase 43 family protein n=1 Tax=Deinococcus cellulosilyticus (strain DSM 18568 / NBRC 106333 / KACC 11606 / 5516J-15) TaxID=1223518 RepID=A0A511N8Y8_DEIC1|nr:glycoside hydrolase family 43 protein [Deinococcus cellulosilyticus]GEM49272.1 glycoside hydrolase 43 family protein [Deinococcus cellulosilyticus NBRC 106333 = KACC 11606]